MEAVAGGLPRLLAWCRVVRLDASGAHPAGGGLRVCAGGISACARARFDGIKTRIQSVPAASAPLKIWCVIRQMAAEEKGFKAFTRGLGVTLVRAFPVNVVTFLMYEGTLSCRCYLP